MRIKILSSFMFSPLGSAKAKNKNQKRKSLDSGFRRNDGKTANHNRTEKRRPA